MPELIRNDEKYRKLSARWSALESMVRLCNIPVGGNASIEWTFRSNPYISANQKSRIAAEIQLQIVGLMHKRDEVFTELQKYHMPEDMIPKDSDG